MENIGPQVGDRSPAPANKEVVKSVRAVGLIYVSGSEPGFTRERTGEKSFRYLDGKNVLKDKEQLQRIKSLVIPPAWEDVWICKNENGHLQVTGLDLRKRKQYRYHPRWVELRNMNKFSRLRSFGESLPVIRQNLEKDLSSRGLNQDKVLAAVVSLLERVYIRIGNSFYEKLYGSFGLTTLKNRHVKINGSLMSLSFKGKKGIPQKVSLKSIKLARIVSGCKEIPGQELFAWYDEEGNIRNVDSGMVNSYIKTISEGDFSAKDFRTWAGSVQALLAFKEIGGFETIAEMNRKIPAAIDIVARHLGNTRAVCKKYYVHPVIIELYQGNKLDSFLRELDGVESGKDNDGYVTEERILLEILLKAERKVRKRKLTSSATLK